MGRWDGVHRRTGVRRRTRAIGASLSILTVLAVGLTSIAVVRAQEAPEAAIPPGVELALIENVVKSRAQYEDALVALVDHYTRTGQHKKLEQAREELEDLRKVTKYDYVVLVDVLAVTPSPVKSLPEADRLFEDGTAYKNYPATLFVFGKKEKLEQALEKFKKLIVTYPDSDKVAEAAFRIAEIYEGPSFSDFALAAKYYEATFTWDPKTTLPARWRAAQLHEKKLESLSEARRIYQLCANESPDPKLREKATARAQDLGSRGF
jgi:tetratricopeptide (TPR) repeat protein